MFRIIHISDLHLEADLYQPRVIAALCADIERGRVEYPINAVVFSGDAAAKGKTGKENVKEILAQFVSHIRSAVGSEIPFLICPGNHDIDLTKRAPMFSPVFSGVTSPGKANDLVKQATSPDAKSLWAHLDGFRELASSVDKEAFAQHPLFYTKKFLPTERPWVSLA